MFEEDSEFEEYRKALLPVTRENLVIEEAHGFKVKVSRGGTSKWVIDSASQVGTSIFGHRYKPLMEEMQELYSQGNNRPILIDGQGYFHEKQMELAEKLTQIYPGNLSHGGLKTYYCNSGSEAVERGCLKAAQLYKGGSSFVGFEDAFHGRTSLALSHTNSKTEYKEGINFLARTLTAKFATETGGQFDEDPQVNAEKALEDLHTRIQREGYSDVNSILIEPLQGEGGYNVPHQYFMDGLQEIANQHDIPLIFDEVQSAIRTGEWFAAENFDVQPDMISVAKAFSGGMTPFGASLIKDEFATDQQSKHSGTFGGSSKECLVALKTIELIEKKNLLENAKKQGRRIESYFEEIEESPIVHETRGIGLFQGIEIRNHEGEPDKHLRDQVLKVLYEDHNILAESCGTSKNTAIRILLPVNVDSDTVDKVMDGFAKAINKVE